MKSLTWSDVYKHRYEWAISAHSKFMKKFDKNLYQTDDIKEQVYVVVYGASQVGKTSLILELIGVEPDCYEVVEKVLRGGRKKGQSSTATVMRYRASSNNFWHIDSLNIMQEETTDTNNFTKDLDDDEATKALGKIRANMEKLGTKYHVEEIDIAIPKSYLTNKLNQVKDVIIRDLPGIKAENQNEQAYVLSSVKRRVESADLVLLMTTIDNLGFIAQKENLELDELENWRMTPARFKVILTKFYSDDSSKRLCQNEFKQYDEIKKENIRTYINKQINTLDNDWDVKKQLYALEVGQSWNKIINEAETSDKETQAIKKLRKEFFEELNDVIMNSANPISRLCYGYQIGDEAQKYKEEETKKIDERICNINGQIKQTENKINTDEDNIKVYKRYIAEDEESIKKKIADLSQKYNEIIFQDSTETINEESKKASNLRSYLNKNIEDLKKQWEAYQISLEEVINIGSFPHCDKVDEVHSHMDKYIIDSYVLNLNDAYQSDKNQVNIAIKEQKGLIKNQIHDCYQQSVNDLIQENEHQKRESKQKIFRFLKRKDNNVKKQNELILDKQELEAYIKRFNNERDIEIEHSRNFSSFVDNEFEQIMTRLEYNICHEKNDMNRLYWVMLLRQLKEDFKKVEGNPS